jgi:hypothetical protein
VYTQRSAKDTEIVARYIFLLTCCVLMDLTISSANICSKKLKVFYLLVDVIISSSFQYGRWVISSFVVGNEVVVFQGRNQTRKSSRLDALNIRSAV